LNNRFVRKLLAPALMIALALIVAAAGRPQGTPTDGVTDYFNASPHDPNEMYQPGPGDLQVLPGGQGADYFSARSCVGSVGIPYRTLQDLARHNYYGYVPTSRLQVFLWRPPGEPQAWVGYYTRSPDIMCLNYFSCNVFGGCVGFHAQPRRVDRRAALRSNDPCVQCTYDNQADIDYCRDNVEALSSAQYNKCIFDANQKFTACTQSCRKQTRQLSSGVVQNEYRPGPIPSTGTGVMPPLAALQKTLDSMAPHYDMTKPGEGLRVIKDILTGMGLGYVARGVPAGLRALAAKTGRTGDGLANRALQSGVQNAAKRSSGSFGNNATPGLQSVAPSWNNLPPGVQLPKILQTTPRPLYPQTRPYSCVQACVKMAVDTVRRRPLPESYLRELARADPATGVFSAGNPNGPQVYTPGIGTPPRLIGDLLSKGGVPNTGLLSNQTVDDLATRTASGYPAVVGIGGTNPANSEEWLHAVLVDAVEGAPGSRTIFYRDPMNVNLLDQSTKALMQNSGYTGKAWMSEQEFAAAMQRTGGQAVYTRP